jgi:cobalt-zinc-cadmium efflux system protein
VSPSHHHHARAAGHAHEDEAGHSHPHRPDPHVVPSMDARLALSLALNLIFVAIEFGYGWVANSVALIADAGHNLSDVLGLGATLAAVMLARRPATGRFTYGLRRASVLAALGNAVLLLFASGAIAWEAVQRLLEPQPVAASIVMVVAGIGLVINAGSAWLLSSGHRHDLNTRSAYLHMLGDAAVSAGVVLSGLIILRTAWTWVDPLVSLVVVAVILVATWGLLRDALHLSMDAVPRHVDLGQVQMYLTTRSGVDGVHDLHVWGMSTSEAALTVHLVAPTVGPNDDDFRDAIATELRRQFGIRHATLQIECVRCHQACEDEEASSIA